MLREHKDLALEVHKLNEERKKVEGYTTVTEGIRSSQVVALLNRLLYLEDRVAEIENWPDLVWEEDDDLLP